jgi:ribosomal protein L14E/L6E/L27E
MDIVKGSVVRATAGRDKDKFFVVLSVEGAYAQIADGKRRKVQKPKNKKLIHLAPTNTVYEGSTDSNPKIRTILRNFKNGG